MCSALPVPSISAKIASLMNGPSMRLTRKPGMSFDSITVLPSSPANARAAAWVASSVSRPRMISISPMTGTGEKKWRPMKRSGRSVAVARPVMLMLLVLLAKMASASAAALMRRPRLALERLVLEDGLDHDVVAGSAVGADGRWRCGPVSRRPPAARACPSRPGAPGCRRCAACPCRPAPRPIGEGHALPAAALTWAMPWPIRPAPMTKTRSMLMAASLPAAAAWSGSQPCLPRCRRSPWTDTAPAPGRFARRR